MAFNRIQFQPAVSLPEFLRCFGSEAHCAAALMAARSRRSLSLPTLQQGRPINLWPSRLATVPVHWLPTPGFADRRQLDGAHQVAVDNRVPGHLFDLISQTKAGLSALRLKRQLDQLAIVGERKPPDLRQCLWVGTVLFILKTTLSERYYAPNYRRSATHCLAAFAHRCNRRFDLRKLVARLIFDVARCAPSKEQVGRQIAEAGFQAGS